MKRSPELAPLSRDHHHALVVARSLCRCQETDAAAVTRDFVRFLRGHELTHFALEESLLLPCLADDPSARALAARVRADHAFFRSELSHIACSSRPSLQRLHTLGERLRDHVRLEEQELFPYVERSLSSEALHELGERLAAHGSGACRPAEPEPERPPRVG